MAKKIFVFVRYSVLTKKNASSFVIGRNIDFETYRNELFSVERMAVHSFLFKNLMLESIKNQSLYNADYEFKLFVLTSKELPSEWDEDLLDATSSFDWANVVYLSANDDVESVVKNQVKKSVSSGDCYATVRLDDDDAISNDFFSSLSCYLYDSFDGFVVSHGLGCEALFDSSSGKLNGFRKLYYPKVSAGLAKISMVDKGKSIPSSIYGVGNHTKVDLKCRTIVDSRSLSFIRSSYGLQDTSGEGYASRLKKDVKKSNSIDAEDVLKYFSLSKVIGF